MQWDRCVSTVEILMFRKKSPCDILCLLKLMSAKSCAEFVFDKEHNFFITLLDIPWVVLFFLLSSNIVVVKIIFSEADYKLAANSKIYFKCKLICTDINTNIWLLLIIKAIKQNCNRDFFQRSKGKIHFLNKNLPQNLRSYKFINILQNLFHN